MIIGVYDSGVGGLTVLSALHKTFPQVDFVYYADTANVPYGTKSADQIQCYAYAAISWLQDDAQCDLIVVACHTVSAVALETIKSQFRVSIIGMIDPLIASVMQYGVDCSVGIIATPASVLSSAHERALRNASFTGKVRLIPCEQFVPLIEHGDVSGLEIRQHAAKYLAPFWHEQLDILVYGCTHYPWIAPIIAQSIPIHVRCIDPAAHVAPLIDAEAFSQKGKVGVLQFRVTGNVDDFEQKKSRLLPALSCSL